MRPSQQYTFWSKAEGNKNLTYDCEYIASAKYYAVTQEAKNNYYLIIPANTAGILLGAVVPPCCILIFLHYQTPEPLSFLLHL